MGGLLRKLVFIAVASASLTVAPPANTDAGVYRATKETIRVTTRPEAHRFRVGRAPRQFRFLVSEPPGVILLLRLTVPHGTWAAAVGKIPHLAGVAISTDRKSNCRRHGPVDICTQPEGWCPMPAAAWRFVLRKEAGPPGEIKLDFIVGSSPSG